MAEIRSTGTTTRRVWEPQPSLRPLIAAGDLVVGKAGGLTVSEARAHGMPMFVLAPPPGQKSANAAHLVATGGGAYHATAAMIDAIAAFVRDPARRAG